MDTSFGVHDFVQMPQKHSVPRLQLSALLPGIPLLGFSLG
jgi:hypothetical protein